MLVIIPAGKLSWYFRHMTVACQWLCSSVLQHILTILVDLLAYSLRWEISTLFRAIAPFFVWHNHFNNTQSYGCQSFSYEQCNSSNIVSTWKITKHLGKFKIPRNAGLRVFHRLFKQITWWWFSAVLSPWQKYFDQGSLFRVLLESLPLWNPIKNLFHTLKCKWG